VVYEKRFGLTERPQFESLSDSPWKLVDAKLPVLGVPFDPNNSATYRRIVFNDQTGQSVVLQNYELEKLKARLKSDPTFKLKRVIEIPSLRDTIEL